MSDSLLRVEDLTKTFDAGRGEDTRTVVAADGVTFSVRRGEFFTLLGPSGCGKTTILRCIAGLETPDSGEIVVSGRTLDSARSGAHVPANARGLGMVFQSYAIWPHMSVHDNVAFPLTVCPRSRRPGRAEIRKRVERMLELVRLGGLGPRPATDLSGGQQQRLALARALVTEPPLLLLDEPLSSIDAKLRAEMCIELKRLQQTLGVTTVYVTHDQDEALGMSSVIAVMEAGQILQIGDPRDVYARPSSRFVAEFIGDSNLMEGVVEERRNGTCVIRTRRRVDRVRQRRRPSGGHTRRRGRPRGTAAARADHVGRGGAEPLARNRADAGLSRRQRRSRGVDRRAADASANRARFRGSVRRPGDRHSSRGRLGDLSTLELTSRRMPESSPGE